MIAQIPTPMIYSTSLPFNNMDEYWAVMYKKESTEIMVCLPGIDFGDQQQPLSFYLLRESVIVDLIDLCGCHDMSRKQFG